MDDISDGYVLPKDYFQKVGPAGFEKKPIGNGPYMVDEYQASSFLRVKANPRYWGGKPPFETVIFKFVVHQRREPRKSEVALGM